jgi:hypothetical protein
MSRDKVDVARRATDAFNRRDFDGAFAELGTPTSSGTRQSPGLSMAAAATADARASKGTPRISVRTGRSSGRSLRSSAISATGACAWKAQGTREGQRRTGRYAIRGHLRFSRRQDLALPGVSRSCRRTAGGRPVPRVGAAQSGSGRPLPAVGVAGVQLVQARSCSRPPACASRGMRASPRSSHSLLLGTNFDSPGRGSEHARFRRGRGRSRRLPRADGDARGSSDPAGRPLSVDTLIRGETGGVIRFPSE